MARLLIQGLSIESTESIKRKLEIHLSDLDILTSTEIEKTRDIVTERSVQLLLMEAESFDNKISNIIADFRVWGLGFPVVLIANQVPMESLSDVKEASGTENKPYLLDAKYEDKQLVGVVKKLLRTKKIPQQRYKRFHTNQVVEVERISEGSSMNTSMYNLSKGGVYLEFDPEDEGKDFGVGDLIRVSVPLNEMDKNHALPAKVVWTTKRGRYSGRQGFGARFISNEEIYRSLLGKIA